MKHNELQNITDADMINAFICGMTCEALGHETLRTTRELLNVTTQYATDEQAI